MENKLEKIFIFVNDLLKYIHEREANFKIEDLKSSN